MPILESGDEATILSDYGITSGEYLRVQTEIYKANKFFTTPSDYLSGDQMMTDSYLERNNYDPKKVYNTFKYRVVQVPIEQPEEPVEEYDESGELIENEVQETSGEKAQRIDDAKAKAEAILDLVSSKFNRRALSLLNSSISARLESPSMKYLS